jgi:hypothetical protein
VDCAIFSPVCISVLCRDAARHVSTEKSIPFPRKDLQKNQNPNTERRPWRKKKHGVATLIPESA